MLNDIEIKLLRLALDKGAYEGEADNAAIMFIRKLRERNAGIDDLFDELSADTDINETGMTSWHYYRMPFGKYKDIMLGNIPKDYLFWVITNCGNIKYDLREAIEKVLYGISR